MQKSLSCTIVFDKLVREFKLLFDFKASCVAVRDISYTETMELKVQVHDMVVATLPGLDQWRSIQKYGLNMFMMKP